MNTIYKYGLALIDSQEVMLPPAALILSAQVQGAKIYIWVELDTTEIALAEPRVIRIHGTGHPVPTKGSRFIDTLQLSGGSLVFHVFEVNYVK